MSNIFTELSVFTTDETLKNIYTAIYITPGNPETKRQMVHSAEKIVNGHYRVQDYKKAMRYWKNKPIFNALDIIWITTALIIDSANVCKTTDDIQTFFHFQGTLLKELIKIDPILEKYEALHAKHAHN